MTAKGLTRVTLIRMARPRGQPNLVGIGLALGSDLERAVAQMRQSWRDKCLEWH